MAEGAFDPTVGLDQSEIADIVNRKKMSNTRQRREMMRMGNTDQASFVQQNQPELQQAQQPQEFWGAGRKLAENQNMDQDLYSIFGQSLTKLGGDLYYYGDTDYSKAQLGTQGYNLVDKGNAIYDITKDGNVLGQSYGSVVDAINANKNKVAENNIQQRDWSTFDPLSGNTINSTGFGFINPTQPTTWVGDNDTGYSQENWMTFSDKKEAIKAYQDLLKNVNYKSNQGYGALADWEVLGQILNGGGNYDTYNNAQNWKYFDKYSPGNNQAEKITGLNQLYGSTPIILNDKVVGYKTDLGPSDPNQYGYKNPFAMSRVDNEGSTRSNYSLWRDMGDLDKWSSIGQFLNNNGDYYIPIENVEKMPGWEQGDINKYHHQSSGAFGKIAGLLGTALSFTPLAPIGMGLSAMSAIASQNPLSMLSSALGMSGLTNQLGNSLGDILGTGSKIGTRIVNAGIGGLSNSLSGGDFWKGALTSGIGSAVGSGLNSLFNSDLAAGLGSSIAKQAASNILNKNPQKNLESLMQSKNIQTAQQDSETEEEVKDKRKV